MTVTANPDAATAARPWTCPFCPLLCDSLTVREEGGRLHAEGSECPAAAAGLASFRPGSPPASPLVDGQPATLEQALGAAAGLLRASKLPLLGGLATDVAGARALYRLACRVGAISDHAYGRALLPGLRTLQDRGQFTTTLAEVRNRADLIVCLGSPAAKMRHLFKRLGVGEALVDARRIVFVGAPVDSALDGAARTEASSLTPAGDLPDTLAVLCALVAGRQVPEADAGLVALAEQLRAARYAVVVWDGAALPAQGELCVEAAMRLVNTLNKTTRAAALPLGGRHGAYSVQSVFTWMSGLPLRTHVGPRGLEHEPLLFDTERLLVDKAVDALVWVASFGTDLPVPATDLPRVVLGHPALAETSTLGAGDVFIPVGTPGVSHTGHLFRTDGGIAVPLHQAFDDPLPSVASVVTGLLARLGDSA